MCFFAIIFSSLANLEIKELRPSCNNAFKCPNYAIIVLVWCRGHAYLRYCCKMVCEFLNKLPVLLCILLYTEYLNILLRFTTCTCKKAAQRSPSNDSVSTWNQDSISLLLQVLVVFLDPLIGRYLFLCMFVILCVCLTIELKDGNALEWSQ